MPISFGNCRHNHRRPVSCGTTASLDCHLFRMTAIMGVGRETHDYDSRGVNQKIGIILCPDFFNTLSCKSGQLKDTCAYFYAGVSVQ